MSQLTLPAKVQHRACYAQLIGAWAVEPNFLESGIAQVAAVGIEAIWAQNDKLGPYPMFNPNVYHLADALGMARKDIDALRAAAKSSDSGDQADLGPPPYINYKGTAIIPVSGPLSKMPTSLGHMFGGSSTVGMRKALALAMADASVQRVMLHIDSPGGTVAGTGDLGDELFQAQGLKPTASFVEDLGASAAYWLASQTGSIYASPHAQVGSIGVIRVVHDSSEAAKAQGVKVHVLKTGPYKGGPVPGAPITPDALKHMQAEVDAFHQVFVSTIARGRNLPEASVSALADGRVFMAPEALRNGLIDAMGSFAAALKDFEAQHVDMLARQAKTSKTAGAADGDEQMGLKRRKGWKPSYAATASLPAHVTVTISEPKASDDGLLVFVSRAYTDSTATPLAEALAAAGVADAQQEAEGVAETLSDELAAALDSEAATKGNASYTEQDHVHNGESPMADPTTNPAGKSAAEPVTLSAAAHEALLRKADEGSQALRLVQELQATAAKNAAAVLDSERERIMADYGLTKEQVSACPDLASLKAMESVARAGKSGGRGGSDPAKSPPGKGDEPKVLDAWAAHEAWKEKTDGGLAALNVTLPKEDEF